ncbi:leukocyte tyrosine kinase receptor [Octopus bimaculoides]|nr:leukocyte tyrosine kinase receptor [Octopus bimaculoides]
MKTIILTHWNRSLTWIVFCTSYVVIQSALGIDKRESFSSRDIVRFSTCNSKRNFGPKQQMCDAAYKDTKLDSITIHPSMPGVQVWTVPRTGEYSILALGAEGGRAIAPLHQSREAKQLAPYAMAYFHLSEGTKLNILIGQKGQDACSSFFTGIFNWPDN